MRDGDREGEEEQPHSYHNTEVSLRMVQFQLQFASPGTALDKTRQKQEKSPRSLARTMCRKKNPTAVFILVWESERM